MVSYQDCLKFRRNWDFKGILLPSIFIFHRMSDCIAFIIFLFQYCVCLLYLLILICIPIDKINLWKLLNREKNSSLGLGLNRKLKIRHVKIILTWWHKNDREIILTWSNRTTLQKPDRRCPNRPFISWFEANFKTNPNSITSLTFSGSLSTQIRFSHRQKAQILSSLSF